MLYQKMGFALGLITLVTIASFWLSGTVREHLDVIAILFATNIVLGFVLPRIFPTNPILKEFKQGSASFARAINTVVVSSALIIVYILGVGLTFLLSRLVGKKFLSLKLTDKAWQPIVSESNLKEMF